jgi:hypothetical protein
MLKEDIFVKKNLKMMYYLFLSYTRTQKKISLGFELSHEFELNIQTQNSLKMSYSTQWLDSKLTN